MPALSLTSIRRHLSTPWLVIVAGVVLALSQTAIGALLAPIGSVRIIEAQCTYFTAEQYTRFYDGLAAEGLLGVYKSHLLIDGIHPLWYALFATSLLALLAHRLDVSQRWNAVLALPTASALFDILENSVQRVFLSDRATITDGLATIGTLCSLLKWTLIVIYLTVAIAWTVKVLMVNR